MFDRSKTVAFAAAILDACYWILDIGKRISDKIQEHQGTRIQYPGSRSISNGFHQNTLIARKHIMQLKG
jgi:hypothetical protein